nr:hypothetical protein [Tanacetum cinerariifolium]
MLRSPHLRTPPLHPHYRSTINIITTAANITLHDATTQPSSTPPHHQFVNEPIVSKPTVKKLVVETSEAKASEENPKVVRKNFSPPLIEDWIADSEDEAKSKPKIEKRTVKPSFAKIEFVQSKKIEQYFLMTDYSLWEVILNRDSPAPTRVIEGVVQPVAPTTAEQRLARKNELKARGTLLMALPDKHQLQKLISQLEIRRESLSQEDINLKFLRSLPAKWRTYTLIWRNKTDLKEQSLDDLFNSLKIYEAEVKSSSSASTSTQNIPFVSSQTTDSTNDPVSVIASVSAASAKIHISALPNVDTLSNAVIFSFFASQSNSPQLDNDDLKQIDADDLEEMDLKWQMAMLTVRARRFLQRIRRNLGANRPTSMGFDMSKVECYNYYKKGNFARECRSPKNTKRNVATEPQRRNVPKRNQPTILSWLLPFQVLLVLTIRYQSREGYHAIPPPYTGTFMPPKPDLVFHDSPNVSDSKDDSEAEILQNALSFVQPTKQVKTPRPSVKIVENSIPAATNKKSIPKPKSHGTRRNIKACFVCKSLTHFIKDYDYYKKKMAQTPARNHAQKGNHQQYARMTLLNLQRHVVPTAVLTKSNLVPINAARPVTAAVPKPHVTRPRPANPIVTKPYSPPRRYINLSPSLKASNFPPKVIAIKVSQVNAVKGVQGKWEWKPKCLILDHVS